MSIAGVFKTGFKVSLAALVFILTIEICARVDDAISFGAPLWGEYSAARLRRYDRDGFQVNVPDASFEKWQNNRLGFRGPEIVPTKASGNLHIVCLGASESYGLYESPGREWPAQLRAMLPTPTYQVINASVAGLSLPYFKPYVQKYVLPLKPDVIVCVVNPSLYALSWEKKQNLKSQGPLLKPVALNQTKSVPGLRRKIMSSARSLPKIKQVFKTSLQSCFPQLLRRYQVQNLQKQVDRAEAERMKGRRPKDSVPEATVSNFRSDLAELVSFINAQGVKVVLTTYPFLLDSRNIGAYPELALDSRRFLVQYSNLGLVDVVDKLNSVIASVAIEHGALLVDSHTLVPKSLEYFGDDCHYTDNGALIVARGIATGIMNSHSTVRQEVVQPQQLGWRQ